VAGIFFRSFYVNDGIVWSCVTLGFFNSVGGLLDPLRGYERAGHRRHVGGEDPIHPKQLVCMKVADGMVRMNDKFMASKESENKRRQTDSAGSTDQNTRRSRPEGEPE
jgi:hypothetical protein